MPFGDSVRQCILSEEERLTKLRLGSLRDSSRIEELINYIFVEFLGGFERGMAGVSGELRTFVEIGMSDKCCILLIKKAHCSSCRHTEVSRRRKRASHNTIR